jgi:hypothetical protein
LGQDVTAKANRLQGVVDKVNDAIKSMEKQFDDAIKLRDQQQQQQYAAEESPSDQQVRSFRSLRSLPPQRHRERVKSDGPLPLPNIHNEQQRANWRRQHDSSAARHSTSHPKMSAGTPSASQRDNAANLTRQGERNSTTFSSGSGSGSPSISWSPSPHDQLMAQQYASLTPQSEGHISTKSAHSSASSLASSGFPSTNGSTSPHDQRMTQPAQDEYHVTVAATPDSGVRGARASEDDGGNANNSQGTPPALPLGTPPALPLGTPTALSSVAPIKDELPLLT